MSKKLGNDYRIWVESAVAGTYNEIKGNQDLSISRDGGTIDTSTKSDFPYGTQAPGLRQTSITASFIPDLPDANGYTRFETLASAAVATPIGIQVRKGGASGATPGDVVFECDMYATQVNHGMGQNAPVTLSTTLVAAAAPSIDALS
jgi:hypothetical protein